MKTQLCNLLTITQDGYRIRFTPSNLSEQLWVDPHCRDDALAFFRAYLREGDTVIDVGANIGDTVLTAANVVGEAGHVWAFEAHPRTFAYLQSNLRFNDVQNVRAMNFAAGNMRGEVVFGNDRRDDMNRVGATGVVVPVRRLDDQIPIRETIALMKVDVEGFEKPVLEGAEQLLAFTQCIHFEISRLHFSWYNYSIRDLLNFLELRDFNLFRIVMGRALIQVDPSYDTDGVENLVGIKDVSALVNRTKWEILKCETRPSK